MGRMGKKKGRLERGADKIQTEKLCPREAEFIVCPRSISPASFLSLFLSYPFPPSPPPSLHVGALRSRRKYLNDIFFLPLYSPYYGVRITRTVYVPRALGATHKLPLFSLATLNRRGNKIFLLTRHRGGDQSLDIHDIRRRREGERFLGNKSRR